MRTGQKHFQPTGNRVSAVQGRRLKSFGHPGEKDDLHPALLCKLLQRGRQRLTVNVEMVLGGLAARRCRQMRDPSDGNDAETQYNVTAHLQEPQFCQYRRVDLV